MSSNKTGIGVSDWVMLLTVLSIGVILFLVFIISGLMRGREDIARFTAPGETSFTLSHPGSYLIFHKIQRTVDSQDLLRPPGLHEMEITLQSQESGAIIPLEDAQGASRYVIQRTLAESHYRFRADSAGEYMLIAEYRDPERSGEFHFAVAQDFREQIQSGLLKGGGVMALTIVLVTVIAMRAHKAQTKERPQAT